ncbi:dTDP-4-dehydrorhamnose 3,5-epimerase family protein [Alicyclobacillus tolerans]|uniref:dTDP-4-dehydrorhamnose 3,5-epimerase family protein n=1 Tax=Alicyclobacillus tolerans TaxID=90970 RepID=UPI001F021963|nr:dTDP-4-dehydrorhamnose 3,5-epimerase family protein [Alicyclobacillus tolerans]MCF8567634.1 dTDP-4-dehydrorhamnose 3,5-epimerase family protein [Alicyclobacillus tolerans]
MIDGVVIKPLRRIVDDRGIIMKMQEASDNEYKGFGEIYFSTIYPGVVKGWHLHENAILNYAVIKGNIKLVLFDPRELSPTHQEIQEIYMGDDNYCLVQIPAEVWNAFKGIGPETAMVADLITVVHHEDLIRRMDPHNNPLIPYDWKVRDR